MAIVTQTKGFESGEEEQGDGAIKPEGVAMTLACRGLRCQWDIQAALIHNLWTLMEAERLELRCGRHNLELNTLETVEMMVDFRRHPSPQLPLTLSNCLVSTVETFNFLGITVSQDLKWAININSILKKAQQRMYFLRLLRKHGLPQDLLRQFYTAVIESVLCSSMTVWFSAATKKDKLRLQRTIKRIVGTPLPTIEDTHAARTKARACKILWDPPHPGHHLFQLLPSEPTTHLRSLVATMSPPSRLCLLVLLGALVAWANRVDPHPELREILENISGIVDVKSVNGIPPFNGVIRSIKACQNREEVKLVNATLQVYMRVLESILRPAPGQHTALLDSVPEATREHLRHNVGQLTNKMRHLTDKLARRHCPDVPNVLHQLSQLKVDDVMFQKRALSQFLEVYNMAAVIGSRALAPPTEASS
ncbi:uncharacterized protein LOC133397065 isoform X2 [Phycodurus eques]|uniref:uncharacterized protein LOC133397065 isoform X2 n=1 Tax=Phycodurus eques TaxID=693459 RepID=UPI002ACE641D|nr:uncharacterized protein LOC133397065 isoform X2 [Phycodurus eques]